MRIALPVLLVIVIAVLTQVAGTLYPTPDNWGVHHYAFLPRIWLAGGAALALALAAIWAAVSGRKRPSLGGIFAAGAAIVGGAIFWFARERAMFLGDGSLLVSGVATGRYPWFNEPLSFWGLTEIHRATGGGNPGLTVALTSVAAGVLVTILAVVFARTAAADRGGQLFAFLFVMTAGLTRLFYGYAETYPLLALVVMAYAVFALRHADGKGSLWPAVVLFIVAVPVHITALSLLPSLVAAAVLGARPGAERNRRVALAVALPVVALVAHAFWLWRDPARFAETFFHYAGKTLPLDGPVGSRFPYTLLSARHFLDFFQEQLLIGPFAALLAVPLALLAGRNRAGHGATVLLWAGLPWWLASFLYNREIGAPRDWDLFSVASLPLLLYAATVLVRHPWRTERPAMARGILAAVLAVATFHTAGWVLSGVDADREFRRFAFLFGPGSHASPFARGYAFEAVYSWYVGRGDLESAEVALTESHNADPSNVRIAGNLGSLRLQLGRVNEALGLLEQAAARDSSREVLQFQLGGAYRDAGRLDDAAAAFQRAIAINPAFRQAYVSLATLRLRQDRAAEAESLLTAARAQFPNDGEILAGLGTVYEVEGKTDDAIQAYTASLVDRPDDPVTSFNLARLQLGRKRFGEAAILLRGLTARIPGDVEAWVNLGAAETGLGRLDEASAAYAKAKELDPRRPEPYMSLARIALLRGDKIEAIDELTAYTAQDSVSDFSRNTRLVIDRLRAEVAADTSGGGKR